MGVDLSEVEGVALEGINLAAFDKNVNVSEDIIEGKEGKLAPVSSVCFSSFLFLID